LVGSLEDHAVAVSHHDATHINGPIAHHVPGRNFRHEASMASVWTSAIAAERSLRWTRGMCAVMRGLVDDSSGGPPLVVGGGVDGHRRS